MCPKNTHKLFKVVGVGHASIVVIFFGSVETPSLETKCPKCTPLVIDRNYT